MKVKKSKIFLKTSSKKLGMLLYWNDNIFMFSTTIFLCF